jgi:hypothetical protein
MGFARDMALFGGIQTSTAVMAGKNILCGQYAITLPNDGILANIIF